MAVFDLNLGSRSYQIMVECGLREQLAKLLQPWQQGQRWLVLGQHEVRHYGAEIMELLRGHGFDIAHITIDSSEEAKSLHTLQQVWEEMVRLGCDRSTVMLALGGGVVGDVCGFVAATYMRGIRYIQIPTTLLAMVDSAIGGKTGINLAAGKNLVGAIHQPQAVFVDPDFLHTLPPRVVSSSMAEIVKYGFIRDPRIFTVFENHFDQLLALADTTLLTDVIAMSCQVKCQIVSNDEFEQHERKLLNYGHTIGHALEVLHHYDGLYHGEAVAYGMKCASHIAYTKNLIDAASYQRMRKVLDRFPLPRLQRFTPTQVLEVIAHDKKNINGTLSFILVDDIGNGVVRTDVSDSDIIDSLTVLR